MCLLLLSSMLASAGALVATISGRPIALARADASLGCRMLLMQVEAPVKPKIPDSVPQLAPTKPASDKDNEKAKKYKVLLFNDNVNR